MTELQYFLVVDLKSKVETANPFQLVVERITESGMWKNDEEIKKVTQSCAGPWGNKAEDRVWGIEFCSQTF